MFFHLATDMCTIAAKTTYRRRIATTGRTPIGSVSNVIPLDKGADLGLPVAVAAVIIAPDSLYLSPSRRPVDMLHPIDDFYFLAQLDGPSAEVKDYALIRAYPVG